MSPSFIDGETEAQGKEVITPGSRGRLESVPQLRSPVLSPTSGGTPGAPILHPPTTPFQLWSPGAEGHENQWVLFLFRKPHGHALRACGWGSSCWGSFVAPVSTQETSRGAGMCHQPLHVSSKQPGSSLWGLSSVGGQLPPPRRCRPRSRPPALWVPRTPAHPRGAAANCDAWEQRGGRCPSIPTSDLSDPHHGILGQHLSLPGGRRLSHPAPPGCPSPGPEGPLYFHRHMEMAPPP